MSKAEERALEAYPIEMCGYVTECKIGAKPEPQDWNEERRKCFQEGYHQAEKDLALTWEDIKTIDKLLNQCVDYSNPYQEVLKRFKERKDK